MMTLHIHCEEHTRGKRSRSRAGRAGSHAPPAEGPRPGRGSRALKPTCHKQDNERRVNRNGESLVTKPAAARRAALTTPPPSPPSRARTMPGCRGSQSGGWPQGTGPSPPPPSRSAPRLRAGSAVTEPVYGFRANRTRYQLRLDDFVLGHVCWIVPYVCQRPAGRPKPQS